MKRLSLGTLILGLSALVSVAQEPGLTAQQREALCKSVPCREATTVTLRLNDRHRAEFSFPRGPFVADGVINILNGERFTVEFDEKDGRLLEPHYVKEITHADRTISLELSQLESGTILKIADPFSKAIIYDYWIQHYKQRGFNEVRFLAVGAGLKSVESWPYPITQVVISHVRYETQSSGGIGPGPGNGSHPDPDNRRARVTSKPEPEGAAKSAADTEIVITVSAVFRSNGEVTDIKVIGVKPKHFASQGIIDSCKKKAIQAAKRIKFEPAKKDGRAVSQYMQLEYKFNPPDYDDKP